jgi:hypothetical protein
MGVLGALVCAHLYGIMHGCFDSWSGRNSVGGDGGVGEADRGLEAELCGRERGKLGWTEDDGEEEGEDEMPRQLHLPNPQK